MGGTITSRISNYVEIRIGTLSFRLKRSKAFFNMTAVSWLNSQSALTVVSDCGQEPIIGGIIVSLLLNQLPLTSLNYAHHLLMGVFIS